MNAPQRIGGRVTMTSREFNQHTSRAKTAADHGPVVITDRGRPAYVLLSAAEYERLNARPKRFVSIVEALADPAPEGDFDYDFQRVRGVASTPDLGSE
jgi:prevent-host-death family protein